MRPGRLASSCSRPSEHDAPSPTCNIAGNIFGTLAQFETDLIWERTNAGLNAARERRVFSDRRPVVAPKGHCRFANRQPCRDMISSLVQAAETPGYCEPNFLAWRFSMERVRLWLEFDSDRAATLKPRPRLAGSLRDPMERTSQARRSAAPL